MFKNRANWYRSLADFAQLVEDTYAASRSSNAELTQRKSVSKLLAIIQGSSSNTAYLLKAFELQRKHVVLGFTFAAILAVALLLFQISAGNANCENRSNV